jgi:hypothetical protein
MRHSRNSESGIAAGRARRVQARYGRDHLRQKTQRRSRSRIASKRYLWIPGQVVKLFIDQLVKSDSPTPTWRVVMAKKAKKAAKAKKAKKTRAKK